MFSNHCRRYSCVQILPLCPVLCLFIYGCTVFGKAPSVLGVKSAFPNRSAVTFVALLCGGFQDNGTPTHTNKTLNHSYKNSSTRYTLQNKR